MKNATCLSLLLLPLFLAAQPKIKSKTTELADSTGWRYYNRFEYNFNQLGLETSSIYYYFYDDKWVVKRRELNEYDDSGNRTQYSVYEQFPDSSGLYFQIEQQSEVDASTGCISQRVWNQYNEEGTLTSTDKYQYYFSGPACRKDSVWSEYCSQFNNFWYCIQFFQTFDYDANGNRTVMNIGNTYTQTGEVSRHDSALVWVYDTANRLIALYQQSDIGNGSKIVYEYNPDGTRASEREYDLNKSVWTLTYITNYSYDYDLQGFLIEKTLAYTDVDINHSYNEVHQYFNYCDGMPKYELVDDFARVTYEYTEGVECGTNWAGITPTIAPNPVDDFFTVNWPKMELGKTRISLHNTVGSEVNGYRINYRTEAVEVDVSSLPPGIYFLQILEGRNRFGEKVVVY